MQRISRRDDPAPSIAAATAALAASVTAKAYCDALYLYGSGVLTWAELVTKHRELRAAIHQRRAL